MKVKYRLFAWLLLAALPLTGCKPETHTHSFDLDNWCSDGTLHWHAATCGHEVRSDEGKHGFDKAGKCRFCGYQGHIHTYSDIWGSDDNFHWHAPTCGDVQEPQDKERHTLDETGKVCTVCGTHIGALVAENINAWIDYPGSPMCITNKTEEALTFQWDAAKLKIDTEKGLVTALQPGNHLVTVTAGSQSTTFTVRASYVSTDGWKEISVPYAQQLAGIYRDSCTDGATTVFVGDSFFDARGFFHTFSTDLAGKDALCAGIGATTATDWENYLLRGYFLHDMAPKNLVINLGTNDLYDDGLTQEQTAADLQRLFLLIHDRMPETKLYYFSISKRANNVYGAQITWVNDTMKKWCAQLDWITFVDISGKLTADDLFDGVHPKAERYGTVFIPALLAAGCRID